ncbi:MAG: acetoacetate--CoA ligase [Planctomycetes bacterium]|nr:acetoacetate--CoA ligase [Planctomycetota bacterium]
MSDPLWKPNQEKVDQANLTAFIRRVRQHRPNVNDFPSLYEWSIERPAEFWEMLWGFCEVLCSRPWDSVLTHAGKMPGAKWFSGARLNFAENLLRHRDRRDALVFWNEQGRQRSLTYAELYRQVAGVAQALRKMGVTAGDRVAGLMPNVPETIVAMLATTSVGAIWSSTSPDFGMQGVMDRFGQIEPKVLFTADGYRYNGKEFETLDRAADVVDRIPSIENTVVAGLLRPDPALNQVRDGVSFDALLRENKGATIDFEQLPFAHPLYILYSSGTTGVPKCIVHGAGGTLLQHLKELVLHTDLKSEDRIFYFTTCGWMMWNWLVSSLAVGATVVLYDGSPFHSGGNILFDMAEQERVTVFGTSARFLTAAEKAELEPARTHNLSPLRTILSTGSPLSSESFDYVYEKVKRDVCLSSISGGTDIVSCFALGNPIGTVYRGELQTRGLGMKVQVYNDDGEPIRGEKGELVCAAPFPSMPVCFWNDPDGEKYRAAYFEHFPGVWRHGDYVELTERDGMVFHGRSDAVLNPGGVRIGTAEIYRQIEQLDEILESVVVGQQWERDVRVVLFVKLRPGAVLDEELSDTIRQQIRSNTTPRHVPHKIIQVADIPRTISGKTVELAVRNAIHGEPINNRDALANPESLELFENLPALKN